MEALMEAVKSNDLVKVTKAFNVIMAERTTSLIEQRKKDIAKSVMIEGEEKSEKDELDADDAAKKAKAKELEDSGKNNGKEVDSKKPNENERTA